MTNSNMRSANNYHEWQAAAIAHDKHTGAAVWRTRERSSRYDYRVIRNRLTELKKLRRGRNPTHLLFYLREGVHGNMGGIGESALYRRAKFGTKDLITEYISETVAALDQIAEVASSQISIADKLELFHHASQCFGRSALMLSGGGALGPFHVGVVKALHQQDLLPNVISGASAGSLVAALIGTRSAAQLAKELAADALAKNFSKAISEQDQSRRTLTRDALRFYIEQQIPDMTFAEALEVSGRRINISISPREIHQQSRLMNAVTSPNVLIRETVLASCAIPGVFDPVTLAARNASGKRQAYIPSRQWVDGSVTDDLPSQRLSRLYGVNHLITSQTNPIVLWALQDSQAKDTLLARFWESARTPRVTGCAPPIPWPYR